MSTRSCWRGRRRIIDVRDSRYIAGTSDWEYHRYLVYKSYKREVSEITEFLSSSLINHVEKPSSLTSPIVSGRILKHLERKVQCILMIEYSNKVERKPRQENGENESIGNTKRWTVPDWTVQVRDEEKGKK